MTSVSVVSTSGLRGSSGNMVGVDRLPGEMNDMKIRDDKKKLNSSTLVPKQLMLNQEMEKKRKVILEASHLQEICIVMVKSHPSDESELKAGAEFFESNTTLSLQQENRPKQMGATVIVKDINFGVKGLSRQI